MSNFPGERCQHIKMNGQRCGSPALRNQEFCYFHDRCCPVTVDVSTSAQYPAAPFFLPVLEDATSIQATITQVCKNLLHHRLDPKKAGILLYAMQVASSNLSRLDEEKKDGEENEDATEQKSQDHDQESRAERTARENARAARTEDMDPLPPGTIQACEQPRRFAATNRR
jgi:hypothetical protein